MDKFGRSGNILNYSDSFLTRSKRKQNREEKEGGEGRRWRRANSYYDTEILENASKNRQKVQLKE